MSDLALYAGLQSVQMQPQLPIAIAPPLPFAPIPPQPFAAIPPQPFPIIPPQALIARIARAQTQSIARVPLQAATLSAFPGWETQNRYIITDNKGEPVFYVTKEEVGACCCCERTCLVGFNIYDKNQHEVLRMIQRTDDWNQVLEVYSGNTLLGSLVQNSRFWQLRLYICDASGRSVLMIKKRKFCTDNIFKVKSVNDKHHVVMIEKRLCAVTFQGTFSASYTYDMYFSPDLDVKIKAMLLGACLLIDSEY
ncbi:PREDICTED: phospholipid scramblase 3-like [Wasmannia auropunctata]|uniref:phospholipid scramblase 3-like n=1 Tax=Wasmannia auropunctata TaxID=64793 RepID=UPI0005F04DE4|nr:PREDICTED: phospholipid scramblase 3-like [Wasmannia auropunctata]